MHALPRLHSRRGAPGHGGRRAGAPLAWIALAATISGCATGGADGDPQGSVVRYELLSPSGGGLEERDDHDDSPEIAAASVGVRYDRITRPRLSTGHAGVILAADRGGADRADRAEPTEPPSGAGEASRGEIVLPYPTDHFFRGFGACRRGGRHHHEAIDLGGVGPDWGLGTPIVSMARARIELIGDGDDDPGEFGRPDERGGATVRGRTRLPRSRVIDGYGRVHFFTRTKGRWRSGTVVVTRGVGGPLDGHRIRYMHLGAVHPSLRVGDVVEAGQEIGLMGGTGVQKSAPHVHIDVEEPDGRRVDVAPLLGLPATARGCGGSGSSRRAVASSASTPRGGSVAGGRVWTKQVGLPRCGAWSRDEDFSSGRYDAHDVRLRVHPGGRVLAELVRERGGWHPRIEVFDSEGRDLLDGASADHVTAALVRGGREDGRATLALRADRPAEVTVRLTAWPSSGRDLLLPRDGRYHFAVSQRCRR